MKKLIYLLLFCVSALPLSANDYTFGRVYTVGKTYTIDPATDLNIPNTVQDYISWQYGGKGLNNVKYVVSDATAFSIVPIANHFDYGGSNGINYYSFQITPQKTGQYTFYQELSQVKGVSLTYHHTVTYNITVVNVTKITIPSTLTVKIGDTYTFSPVITDNRATTTLTWQSSNTSVATITSAGKLTAKAVGTTTITCTAHNGVSAKCVVTVNPVLCTGVTMSPTTATLTPGDTKQLTATVTPSNATNKTLKWATNNANVATVNGSGLVTAVAPGNCTISATTTDGSNKSATCQITVNTIKATSVTLDKTSAELFVGEKTQLTATVVPASTTNKAVSWETSNSGVAQVNNGQVTAVNPGQCDITVKTTDGSNKSATCRVNVPVGKLYAENALGVPSGTLLLPIHLKNVSAVTGMQFELQLPEGVSVATDSKGKMLVSMSDRAVDQSIMGSKMSNGNNQFVVFSGTSAALTGNEGVIAYISLNVGADMTVGEYTISIKEVELTTVNGESSYHQMQTSKLTLTQAMTGDINGDGKVTVTDAVGIVNYILHRAPSVFITTAADVNGDGNISISDAVSVVNIVLNK